jgi:hypothetical protein
MLSIENTLVSLDVIEENFVCDLHVCKGACCVKGDFGAPLEKEELTVLEQIYEQVKPYLTAEGIATLEEEGKHIYVEEEEKHATPLRQDGACAYAVFENGRVSCGIEKAWKDGKISFQKPISCHLYPIRIKRYRHYEAVNYERWSICKAACKKGNLLKMPVYRFVKDAIIRKYGESYYEALEALAKNYRTA